MSANVCEPYNYYNSLTLKKGYRKLSHKNNYINEQSNKDGKGNNANSAKLVAFFFYLIDTVTYGFAQKI